MTISVTVEQQPSKYTPAYNEMVFVLDSSNKTNTNFKYVLDVYDKAGTTIYARLKQSPRPDGYAVFDISEIIQSFIKFDIQFTVLGFQTRPNSYFPYAVKFGEEYGDTPTVHADILTLLNLYAFNAVFDELEWIDYNPANYTLHDGSLKHFLTNAPDNYRVRLDTSLLLSLMTDAGTDSLEVADSFEVKSYTGGGALIGSFNSPNSFPVGSSDAGRFLMFAAGPYDFNRMHPGFISADVAKYTVQILDANGDPSSELRTFVVQGNCSRFEIYRLHFLNKLGGFDAFDFSLASTKTKTIERSNYERIRGRLDGTSWSSAKQDRGQTTYDVKEARTMHITSDWISEPEAVWLSELFGSPEVYLERDHALIPIIVSSTSYEEKQKATTKLINIELDFEYAYNLKRQRQ